MVRRRDSHLAPADRAADVAAVHQLAETMFQEINAGHFAAGARLARQGLRRVAAHPAETELRARLLTNLASCVAERGQVDEALRLLDEAVGVDADFAPRVLSARGVMHFQVRAYGDALAAYNAALTHRPPLDDRARSSALLRRGIVHMVTGSLTAAIADFGEAGTIAQRAEQPILVWYAGHNLGWAQHLRGDLPAALDSMDLVNRALPNPPIGDPTLDRARVLLAAGLLREADDHARRALTEFESEGRTPGRIDALLALSEIQAAARNRSEASRFARRAAGLAGRHRMVRLGLVAALAAEQAQPVGARGAAGRARRAQALVENLTGAGLPDEATVARLLQAQAEIDQGRFDAARHTVAAAGRAATSPTVAVRLHARLVHGRLGLNSGERRRGLRELDRGLDELAGVQARFGSVDLQSGVAVHGLELGQLGLRTAVEGGSPAEILHWLERARAVTTRLPAVHPPTDPELAELLGALRAATGLLREATLAGRDEPQLRRRLSEVRAQVRGRSWVISGTGTARRPLTLTGVQRLLAADPAESTVLAYLTGGDQIFALVIGPRRARFFPLGDWLNQSRRHQRRLADLDTLAADHVPAPIRAVARRSIEAEFARLGGQLVEPLAGALGEGPVLVTAVGEEALIPFGLLPGLRGRPVSIGSSVTAALADAGRPGRAHLRGVLAVAGPRLGHGAAEVAQVAALHPGAGTLVDGDATGEAVLAQIPAGGLLHIAAHGHHEPESPLFSSVQLADGPLYAYDIAPNPTLPDQVVLSCCDVGRSSDRPGDEPLGLAAALLRSGVSSVVAGVSKVNDELASAVMVDYHRALLEGSGPAAALAAAVSATGELAPFSCFGAGG